jgi:hypothetical protein
MARKPQMSHAPKASKERRTGYEKMQLNHARTRDDIKRILAEGLKRADTGKPRHLR